MLRKDVVTDFNLDRSSASPDEVERFERLASEWWKRDGAFKMVHRFNDARLAYLKEALLRHMKVDESLDHPLKGIRIADVGCGAGLVAEPMARMGADLVAIDPSGRNIEIARSHSAAQSVAIDYRHMLPEQLASTGERFDIVLSMEVIEHVADVPMFLKACATLVAPDGILVIATLNRTLKSFLFGIVGAEYVLRLLPRGTHDWRKFIKPDEIRTALAPQGLHETEVRGMVFNPFRRDFRVSHDLSVNFVQLFQNVEGPTRGPGNG